MIEKVYARQIDNGLWQWRVGQNKQWQNQSFYTGDNQALVEMLGESSSVPLCLMLPGSACVTRIETADVSNKRTLAKLIPYELEEDVIDPIEDLHFAYGEVSDGSIPLVYTRADNVKNALENLDEVGCDVRECVPDYLLLPRENNELIVVWEGDQVMAHFGQNQGFSVQTDIAQLYLKQLQFKEGEIKKVTLVAHSEEQCDELMSWLPSELYDGPEIVKKQGGFWDVLEADAEVGDINLRSGAFARQLPVLRWWQSWQKPAYFVGAALLIAVLVNFALYFQAKNEYQKILDARKEIFLQAVPNGRWQTPERELKSRLGGDKNSDDVPSNFMVLLEGVAKVLETRENVTLASLRYSGDQKELVISFEVANFADVEVVRSAIENVGLTAETLRAAAQGDVFQARMKIAGTAS